MKEGTSETLCAHRQLTWKLYFHTAYCRVLSLCIHIHCYVMQSSLCWRAEQYFTEDYLASLNWDDHVWSFDFDWSYGCNLFADHLEIYFHVSMTKCECTQHGDQLLKQLLWHIWKACLWVLSIALIFTVATKVV